MSAFYGAILLIAVGGAGFALWPATLFQLVLTGYLLSMCFGWAMCLFFFPHLQPRANLVSEVVLTVASQDTQGPDPLPAAEGAAS